MKRERVRRITIFILVFLLFIGIGFGMKCFMGSRGYMSDLNKSASGVSSSRLSLASQQQLIETRQCVEEFMPHYFNRDQEKLKSVTSTSLYTLLIDEIEEPSTKAHIRSYRVEKIECHPDKHHIRCFVNANTEEITERGLSEWIERVYELVLIPKGVGWRIDEVNIRGSFE